MTAFSPPVDPSYGSQPKTRFRILSAQFGDGYEQRTGDGLNTKVITWSLLWEGLNAVDLLEITDFFDARGGHEAFDWTPPGEGDALKFKCPHYNSAQLSTDLFTLNTMFEQVFDL